MRINIFKKQKFTEQAMKVFNAAQNYALSLDDSEVCCIHLLAALVHLHPDIVTNILGKTPNTRYFLRIEEWDDPVDPKDELPYSDELNVLFIDSSEDTPVRFIKEIAPKRIFGPAEQAFIILKEPTEEIVGFLEHSKVDNDLSAYNDLLCSNYITCCEKYSAPSIERLKKCIEMGKQFSDYMNKHVTGQEKAIETLSSALVKFWHNGNNNKPLPILLICKSGGGASYFSQIFQEALVELQLQKNVIPPLDFSCFTHNSSVDAELLGSDKAYKDSHPGQLWQIFTGNRRGSLVFENIHKGCDSARNILRALTSNSAFDKFMQKNLHIPYNILIANLPLNAFQYDFLKKHSKGKQMDPQMLLDTYEKTRNGTDCDISVVTAMQEFILIDDLKPENFCSIIKSKIGSTRTELITDYGVELDISGEDNLCTLFQQATPNTPTPKEIINLFCRELGDLAKIIIRHPDVQKITIECGDLPPYKYDITQRVKRGDYLFFQKEEFCSDEKQYTIKFKPLRYERQERVEYGSFSIDRPKNISFSDVVGLDEVIKTLQDSVNFLQGKQKKNLPDPNMNYLLVGAPGCGKTSLLSALAAESGLPTLIVGSDAFATGQRVNSLFELARHIAPCIMVIDEITTNYGMRPDVGQAFLTNLDGLRAKDSILIVGTANDLALSSALTRPGRFSVITVALPSAASREKFVRQIEKKYKFTLSDGLRNHIVKKTDGESVATLKSALETTLRTSGSQEIPLSSSLFDQTLQQITRMSHWNKSETRAVIGFRQ